jgi:hypothetical protein
MFDSCQAQRLQQVSMLPSLLLLQASMTHTVMKLEPTTCEANRCDKHQPRRENPLRFRIDSEMFCKYLEKHSFEY